MQMFASPYLKTMKTTKHAILIMNEALQMFILKCVINVDLNSTYFQILFLRVEPCSRFKQESNKVMFFLVSFKSFDILMRQMFKLANNDNIGSSLKSCNIYIMLKRHFK